MPLSISRPVLAALLLSAAAAHSQVAAQEWTRFRGPNGAGESETIFPAKFKPSDFQWKTSLPGIGHSSPAVWGDRVFLMSADPKTATRYVVCLSASSGKILWNREFPSAAHHLHQRSSFASCSPAVDSERVYIAWSTPEEVTFLALTHAGEDAWKLDLGPWTSQHGFGTSPVIYKDLVFLSNSQQANKLRAGQKPGKSFMHAFDKKTGKEVWRTPRASRNVCYSAPIIYSPPGGGADQLISVSTGNGMYSLDPMTGKEHWSIDVFKMRTVGSPILAGGLLFGTTGSGGGGNYVVAVRPGKTPEIAYEIREAAPYVVTPVKRGELVFLWYDKGILTCIDAETGKEHYRKRLGGGFSGSTVRAADKVYCIREDGVLVSAAATKEFKLLGETELGEDSRSTPAISGGRMFLRTYSHLICVGAESS